MVRSLENKPYEQRLKEPGTFRPEKTRKVHVSALQLPESLHMEEDKELFSADPEARLDLMNTSHRGYILVTIKRNYLTVKVL